MAIADRDSRPRRRCRCRGASPRGSRRRAGARARAGRSRTGAGAGSGPRRYRVAPPAAAASAGRRRSPRRRSFGARRARRRRDASAAPLQGDARLLGVFAERDGEGYALFRSPDRGPLLVRGGQDIAQGRDARSRCAATACAFATTARCARSRCATAGRASTGAGAPTATRASAAPRAACAPPAGFKGPSSGSTPSCWPASTRSRTAGRRCSSPDNGGLAVRDDSGFAAMLGMSARRSHRRRPTASRWQRPTTSLVAVVRPLVASQPVRVAGTRDGKPARVAVRQRGRVSRLIAPIGCERSAAASPRQPVEQRARRVEHAVGGPGRRASSSGSM